jgi:hypothetical protein
MYIHTQTKQLVSILGLSLQSISNVRWLSIKIANETPTIASSPIPYSILVLIYFRFYFLVSPYSKSLNICEKVYLYDLSVSSVMSKFWLLAWKNYAWILLSLTFVWSLLGINCFSKSIGELSLANNQVSRTYLWLTGLAGAPRSVNFLFISPYYLNSFD